MTGMNLTRFLPFSYPIRPVSYGLSRFQRDLPFRWKAPGDFHREWALAVQHLGRSPANGSTEAARGLLGLRRMIYVALDCVDGSSAFMGRRHLLRIHMTILRKAVQLARFADGRVRIRDARIRIMRRSPDRRRGGRRDVQAARNDDGGRFRARDHGDGSRARSSAPAWASDRVGRVRPCTPASSIPCRRGGVVLARTKSDAGRGRRDPVAERDVLGRAASSAN